MTESSDIIPLSTDSTPFDALCTKDSCAVVRDLMAEVLNDRERAIVCARLGIDGRKALSLRAIGKLLNITGERVRGLQSRAFQKLRLALQEKETPPSRRDSEYCLDRLHFRYEIKR